ncbi:MAG: rebM 4 [Gammaproteobacteria bacterium]|nr:rebM 4 [Gammaproteobacteria bacterium]
MNIFAYDFGYDGPWSYGHLIAAVIFAVMLGVSFWRNWPLWTKVLVDLLLAWSIAGYVILQLVLRINLPLELPTDNFLTAGTGQVLDAGAGSGRSSLMVLQGRPQSRVIALDLYAGYFGIQDNTPDRLYANARLAGVADRLEAKVGDMREIPLADETLDAAVSAYAIDHLEIEGIKKSFAEIRRVLRPDGEFLLMVINNDVWIRIAYPFFLHHGYFGPRTNIERWRNLLTDAGFEVLEQGTQPATLYFLVRKGT